MEESRAAAGGVVINGLGGGPQQDDPMAILGKLKQMLDAGLISQGEFDAKKTDLLAKM
jgi:Short C-terminal domain